MTAPLDLDAMRKRAYGGSIPGVTGGVPGVSIGVPSLPSIPGPTDTTAPITTGVPLGLGDPSIPFSQPTDTWSTQPVRQPTPTTTPSTGSGTPLEANPMATSDPMAFANSPKNPTPSPSPLPPPLPSANPQPPAPLEAPAGYVPGATVDIPGYGSVMFDAQGHPSIDGRMVDANGQPIVAPSMSQEAWIAQNTANSPYHAPATVIQTDAPIAGGTADNAYTFEQLLGLPTIQKDPTATLGSTGVTKQQLIDAGFGHLVGYDDWQSRSVGEFSPMNIDLAPAGSGARQDGYYEGGASTGTYHPANEGAPLGLVNDQYVDQYGRVVDDIENAANGIDPVTHQRLAPLYDQPTVNTSGKNPNGAYLTDGTAPSAPPLATGGAAGGRPGSTPTLPGPTAGVPLPIPLPTTPVTPGVGGGGDARGPVAPVTPVPLPAGGIPLAPSTGAGNPAAASAGAVPAAPAATNASLLGKTITPQNIIDRFGLAQDKFDAFAKSTDPAYQATLRDTNRYNFGAGRGVSGMARNSIGDVATQRTNALDTQRTNFLTDALTGTIEDLYRNIGIEQQQQGFQKDLSDTAFSQGVTSAQLKDALENSGLGRTLATAGFNRDTQAQQFGQAVTSAQLQDALTNSDFGRWLASSGFDRDTQALIFNQAMQKAALNDSLTNSAFGRASAQQQAGYANNPADIMLILSQIFGSQASAAGQAAAGSFANAGNRSGSGGIGSGASDAFTQWLLSQLSKTGTAKPTTTTSGGYTNDYPWAI